MLVQASTCYAISLGTNSCLSIEHDRKCKNMFQNDIFWDLWPQKQICGSDFHISNDEYKGKIWLTLVGFELIPSALSEAKKQRIRPLGHENLLTD